MRPKQHVLMNEKDDIYYSNKIIRAFETPLLSLSCYPDPFVYFVYVFFRNKNSNDFVTHSLTH